MNEAVEDLKNGKYIWIYPEGTRNHGQELLPFREGSFKIAEKARCKIVDEFVEVEFYEPVLSVTSGQAGVMYDINDGHLIGGGWI